MKTVLRLGTAALLAACAVPCLGRSPDPTSGDILLFPGIGVRHYSEHAGQANRWNIPGSHFKPGGGWWALKCDRDCVLTQQTLGVDQGTHPDYDGPPLPSQLLTWRETARDEGDVASMSDGAAKTLMSFKPIRSLSALRLRSGKVTTWWQAAGSRELPAPSESDMLETRIDMGESGIARLLPKLVLPRKNVLDPVGGGGTSSPPLGESAATVILELRIGERRQKLGAYQWDIEGAHPLFAEDYLVWGGDLDGDGRLDLLMNFSGRGWHQVLYLSSLAGPDELVGEAGRFSFWPPDDPGC